MKVTKNSLRLKRKIRIRKKISGTVERPRLSVYKSLNHIYAQLIDDTNSKTLAAASTLSKDIEEDLNKVSSKIEKSKVVGKLLAKKAAAQGITQAVFDRNTYRYHGRVKALAESVREEGIKI